MIADIFENLSLYSSILPHFTEITHFLSNNLSNLPDGKVHIVGDDLFASVQSYTTKPLSSAQFESHDQYIDLQFLLRGEELCGISEGGALTDIVIPYNVEKDIRFLSKPSSYSMVALHPGNFAIFFPSDAHMPGIFDDRLGQTECEVKKCVIKIRAK